MVKIYTQRNRANYFTTTAKYCNEIVGTSTYHAPSLHLLQIIILLITISISFQFTSYTFISRISPSKGHIGHRIQYQHQHQISTSSILASKSKHQYQIGDKVLLINNEDGATYQSGIVEQKKGGWYTICIDNDSSNNRVKRRASQLIQKSESWRSNWP